MDAINVFEFRGSYSAQKLTLSTVVFFRFLFRPLLCSNSDAFPSFLSLIVNPSFYRCTLLNFGRIDYHTINEKTQSK